MTLHPRLAGPGRAARLVLLLVVGPVWAAGSARAERPDGEFYEYAPAIVLENGIEHVFACANIVAGEIRDHIVHRRYANGREVATDIALRPSEDRRRFDSYHVCDPEVIAGRFSYNDRLFTYALLYTANDRPSARGNRIGMALADGLDGPWQRIDEPLVPFDFGGGEEKSWGVGQPAAVNIERGDRFLLFYTEGARRGTRTLVRSVRISPEGSAPFTIGQPTAVPEGGLRQADGETPDFLNNVAVAYVPSSRVFVVIRPMRPLPDSPPTTVEARQEIDAIDEADLKDGVGKWRKLAIIGPSMTAAPRNHNAGLLKDIWGNLPTSDRIEGAVTTSGQCATARPCFPAALWTYRLHRFEVPLPALR
jgi:hypothetical protein